MSKRGETKPWKVIFQWTNGVRGTDAYSSRDLAELKADEIRRAGERRDDIDVTVDVVHKPARGKVPA